jgi:hypothetical protein
MIEVLETLDRKAGETVCGILVTCCDEPDATGVVL